MKKWVLSAVIYLAAVTAAYSLYQTFGVQGEEEVEEVQTAPSESGHNDHKHQHHEEQEKTSEITVDILYQEGTLLIDVTDEKGEHFGNLQENHEKIMHLVIVDQHLQSFYHVHPEETGKGTFKVAVSLPDGTYKAFADIKPAGKNYQIQPVVLNIGAALSEKEHAHPELQHDQDAAKNSKVTLMTENLEIRETAVLKFNVQGTEIQPYLGAMGHVVILDEKAENFLHVHPENKQEPVFTTEFSEPGIYKLWAEFKQDGKVTAYPFVVKVEGK
ncbi:hypothetical protein GJU40_18965 [Bacillus lacus]|uniref:Secreted protein n=1 Tax=Metabacillus lacus TaxID=1983721 RepID=A0A7X2J2D7_9BACI|nr:hypothetical protein [Metabacillus lacus]MRX74206.1 hypothetical protein [Metabacillus lacus]